MGRISLVIVRTVEYNEFRDFLVGGVIMDYLSVKEVAEKWGVSRRRVQILCEDGRVEGAYKISDVWVIPLNAEKPADKRKMKKVDGCGVD